MAALYLHSLTGAPAWRVEYWREALNRRWMQEDSLPMPLANYDPIRNGLRNLKAEARSVHPVEQAQRTVLLHTNLICICSAHFAHRAHAVSAWYIKRVTVGCDRDRDRLQRRVHGFDQDLQQMQQAYGLALPARMQIEAQIVHKCAFLLFNCLAFVSCEMGYEEC